MHQIYQRCVSWSRRRNFCLRCCRTSHYSRKILMFLNQNPTQQKETRFKMWSKNHWELCRQKKWKRIDKLLKWQIKQLLLIFKLFWKRYHPPTVIILLRTSMTNNLTGEKLMKSWLMRIMWKKRKNSIQWWRVR